MSVARRPIQTVSPMSNDQYRCSVVVNLVSWASFPKSTFSHHTSIVLFQLKLRIRPDFSFCPMPFHQLQIPNSSWLYSSSLMLPWFFRSIFENSTTSSVSTVKLVVPKFVQNQLQTPNPLHELSSYIILSNMCALCSVWSGLTWWVKRVVCVVFARCAVACFMFWRFLKLPPKTGVPHHPLNPGYCTWRRFNLT